jgi:hypothetical protein
MLRSNEKAARHVDFLRKRIYLSVLIFDLTFGDTQKDYFQVRLEHF